MFAGSCIGVVVLVMILELFRRLSKEYDRYLIRAHARRLATQASTAVVTENTTAATSKDNAPQAEDLSLPPPGLGDGNGGQPQPNTAARRPFRPTMLNQAVRALLHTLTFAIGYFVMLISMYYNGYLIICVFIGAYLGAFCCQWEALAGDCPPKDAAPEATGS